MPLPDRNPKSRCQTPLMSRSQPITIATPMPDASGRVIAKNPQISIRMPQIISPLPVRAADVELVIRTSSLNHRQQSSSSPVSRFHLPPAFCCNAWLDVVGEPELCSAESSWFFRRYSNTSHRRRTQKKNILLRWRSGLPTFYFSSPFATVYRGWQGYRASIISVSPHDFLPRPIEATPARTQLTIIPWTRRRICQRTVASASTTP